jgi:hypothetical protein
MQVCRWQAIARIFEGENATHKAVSRSSLLCDFIGIIASMGVREL